MADYQPEASGGRGAAGGRRQGEHQQRIALGLSDRVGGTDQGGLGIPLGGCRTGLSPTGICVT
jgi:hypothetical protein